MTSTKKPDLASLVEALITAQLARAEADGEKISRPRLRKPATAAQITELEKAWDRSLPPTYRAFLAICNGIADDLGTHRLLGTTDQKWAKKQVAEISEFWDEFDADTVIPLAVPDGDSGIRNFAAFVPGKGAEMAIVDWDNGSELQRFRSFAAYLEDLIELERRVAASSKKEKAKEKKKERDGRAALSDKGPLPKAGPGRKAAFEMVFELGDGREIDAAVARLVEAKPSADELTGYLSLLDSELGSATNGAFARAELAFHPQLNVVKGARGSWLGTINNAISRLFPKKDWERAARWADVARPHVRENPYLGHNLACVYVAVGRIDDAFEMCKAAVECDYPQIAKMRTDADLGPLLTQDRFKRLFGPPDRTDQASRTTIPRNAALEADVAAGRSIAKYATWLTKEGSPLGAVVAADAATSKSPAAKRSARKVFDAYKRDVLGKAFPALLSRMTYFLDKEYYLSFRHGFLEKLDTFSLRTPLEHEEALALLNDPHGLFVQHIALRKAKLDSLELFSRLPAIRQLQCRWTDITQVDSLAPLAGLVHLRALNVSNSKVSDLEPLAKLPLIQLYLDATAVVDLSPLARHPTLSHIALQRTQVRDLSPLFTCPKLCRVDLWDAPVDKPTLDALAKALAKTKSKPSRDEHLMNGYDEGVSHADA